MNLNVASPLNDSQLVGLIAAHYCPAEQKFEGHAAAAVEWASEILAQTVIRAERVVQLVEELKPGFFAERAAAQEAVTRRLEIAKGAMVPALNARNRH